jgi:hypothetical protein
MTDRPMTPAESREALLRFTPEERPVILAMLRGADDNGFLRGAAKLPRSPTPFDSLLPPPPEPAAQVSQRRRGR